METFEAIRTVLAVRAYQDKPIPPETVRRIVEAGHLTGSSMNKQPWHFIVIQDPDMRQRLGSIARSGTYIAQAPLGPSPTRHYRHRREAIPLWRFRWQPRHSIDDACRLGRRGWLQLGWLYWL